MSAYKLPVLGHPPIGLLTSGEVALLRAWAEDYARTAVAVGSSAAVKHPDMQLIEAAPDMLDALRKAVVLLAGACVHSPELEPHETYEAVSAAIAKATGCAS